MSKNSNVIKIIVLLVVVIVSVVAWQLISRNSQSLDKVTSRPTLNKGMTESADAFIIAKVGEKRFRQYFKLDNRGSSDAAPNLSHAGVRVYHFSPLKSLTDNDKIYILFIKQDDSDNLARFVPDCIDDATLCDFNINRQQALDIAKNNGIDAQDLEISWDTVPNSSSLAIKVSTCKQNKSIWIDYRNGRIAGSEPAKYCSVTN